VQRRGRIVDPDRDLVAVVRWIDGSAAHDFV
jgi:hypothetical protein